MIKELYIKNYTLIEELHIEFHSGFSVITGETGAGKSIILGAVSLLLGQRADSKAIQEGKDKCIVEAHFSFEDRSAEKFFAENELEYDIDDCIIRRELNISGKSRAFINDTPVPLSLLKDIGEKLMDIHSQHQNLLLNNEDFQLNVVDIIADDVEDLKEYKVLYDEYRTATKALSALEKSVNTTNDNLDFLRFQYDELTKADLHDGEQETLEEESKAMAHVEDIKSSLYSARQLFDGDDNTQGVLSAMSAISSQLFAIKDIHKKAEELSERTESTFIELQDISREVSNMLEDIDFDPERMEFVNQRLDLIYTLEKKYKCEDISALNAFLDEISAKLSASDTSDLDIEAARKKADECKLRAFAKAEKLTAKRLTAAKKIEENMQSRLVPLGIPNIRFAVEIEDKDMDEKGKDKITFMFSANKNARLQPASQIASGGEIARVMLSLKAMIGNMVKLPTIIFDEIDTGVSGAVAEMMGIIMAEMGRDGRQVISITHLPQIAALGSAQYKVYKEDDFFTTKTHMKELSQEERIQEIATMLSGSVVTDEAISNAKALLNV